MRFTVTTVTLGLGGCLAFAAMGISPAAPMHMAKMKKTSTAQIAQGKALTVSLRCNSCHAADLAGKKGFSPSLHANGVLHEYNAKTWARLMKTGITNDGKPVEKPMPVYHLDAAKSGALYAYLKTLK